MTDRRRLVPVLIGSAFLLLAGWIVLSGGQEVSYGPLETSMNWLQPEHRPTAFTAGTGTGPAGSDLEGVYGARWNSSDAALWAGVERSGSNVTSHWLHLSVNRSSMPAEPAAFLGQYLRPAAIPSLSCQQIAPAQDRVEHRCTGGTDGGRLRLRYSNGTGELRVYRCRYVTGTGSCDWRQPRDLELGDVLYPELYR